MPMRHEVLEESYCWQLLRGAAVGRVAAELDGRLTIRPVNFAVDHATILVRTGLGSTVARLVGHAVVFESDGAIQDPSPGRVDELVAWSVIIEGIARAVLNPDDLMATFDVPLMPWHASPKPAFVRIEATGVSGRYFPVADPSAWQSPLHLSKRAAQE